MTVEFFWNCSRYLMGKAADFSSPFLKKRIYFDFSQQMLVEFYWNSSIIAIGIPVGKTTDFPVCLIFYIFISRLFTNFICDLVALCCDFDIVLHRWFDSIYVIYRLIIFRRYLLFIISAKNLTDFVYIVKVANLRKFFHPAKIMPNQYPELFHLKRGSSG